MNRTIEIRRSNPENFILIEPPLSEGELDDMIEAGVISQGAVVRVEQGEELATVLAHGRLILGGMAMDRSTMRLAKDIRDHLGDGTYVRSEYDPSSIRLIPAV